MTLEQMQKLKDSGFIFKKASLGTDAAHIPSFEYQGIWTYPILEEVIHQLPQSGFSLWSPDKEFAGSQLLNKDVDWSKWRASIMEVGFYVQTEGEAALDTCVDLYIKYKNKKNE